MSFNPNLEIGQVLDNSTLCEIFKCSPQGGMRKSNTTNTLVLITDYTKGIYHDKWIGGILHYTGMGLKGDQDIYYKQNRTLYESEHNGIDVHLFEVINPKEYIYCGRVILVEEPYQEIQLDETGTRRYVWMFPIKSIPENDVIKPESFVFKDKEDYKKRGKNLDKEYTTLLKTKTHKNSNNLKGKRIRHKIYGIGTIIQYNNTIITVKFLKGGIKTLDYHLCIEKDLLEFI